MSKYDWLAFAVIATVGVALALGSLLSLAPDSYTTQQLFNDITNFIHGK